MDKKIFVADGVGFVELMDVFGDDLTVANAARVSFHKESRMLPVQNQEGKVVTFELADRDKKLINFLAKHDHITPFFHPVLRFRLKMPIFVAREWFRHTIGFARNEVSRRYVTQDPECYVPDRLRQRGENVKQGSSDDTVEYNDDLLEEMKNYYQAACRYYKRLLERDNVCPEQARMVLPQSMYTEFIETASLSGYARLVLLRAEATAQKEIQEYARHISVLVEKHFPVSWTALMNK